MSRAYSIYTPLTAVPFHNSNAFRELAPCPALRGMIRCFWGGDSRLSSAQPETIIPDTCCDLIYRVNETTGEISGHFCGVSSEPFVSHPEAQKTSVFGIRFFAWQAYRFSDAAMRETLDIYAPAEEYFARLDRRLRVILNHCKTLEERATYAEELLLFFDPRAICQPVQDAVEIMLKTTQTGDIFRLAHSVFVSTRQLERLFHEYIGLSPKKLSNMIRYQKVWHDALMDPCFSVAAAVEKYGYFDEAHLHHEFLRYHGTPLKAAVQQARKDVVFLQDNAGITGISCR